MDWAGIEPAASPMPRVRNTTLPPAREIFHQNCMKHGRLGLHHAKVAIYPDLSARFNTMGCDQLKELFVAISLM